MDWIFFPPVDTTPTAPDGPYVLLVRATVNDHIERITIFVRTRSGWRRWVASSTLPEGFVEGFLSGRIPDGAGDPRIDPSALAEVEESDGPLPDLGPKAIQ